MLIEFSTSTVPLSHAFYSLIVKNLIKTRPSSDGHQPIFHIVAYVVKIFIDDTVPACSLAGLAGASASHFENPSKRGRVSGKFYRVTFFARFPHSGPILFIFNGRFCLVNDVLLIRLVDQCSRSDAKNF